MVCPSRYASLVRTRRGATPEDPWLESPTPLDHEAWRALAIDLADRMWASLVKLGEAEQGAGKFPQWNALVPTATDVWNRSRHLPHTLDATPAEHAPLAVAVAQDAACMLERIDDALASYGRKPIAEPSIVVSGWDRWGSLAVIAGFIAGVAALEKS